MVMSLFRELGIDPYWGTELLTMAALASVWWVMMERQTLLTGIVAVAGAVAFWYYCPGWGMPMVALTVLVGLIFPGKAKG